MPMITWKTKKNKPILSLTSYLYKKKYSVAINSYGINKCKGDINNFIYAVNPNENGLLKWQNKYIEWFVFVVFLYQLYYEHINVQ